MTKTNKDEITRSVDLLSNQYGVLIQLNFREDKAELWSWGAAWTPRAGELTIEHLSLNLAERLVEIGDWNNVPELLMREILQNISMLNHLDVD